MIWLLGSTGLTGSEVAHLLDEDSLLGKQTICPVRKTKGNFNNIREIEIDFNLPDPTVSLPDPKIVICCLGTTIKKAGSQEAFRFVDYHLPLLFAQKAKKRGATQFILVSSIGADASSSVFYLKTKGELEEMIKALNFTSALCLRPAALMGNRSEFRLGEKIGIQISKLISPLLVGAFKNYRPIQANTVAKVIVDKAKHPDSGFHIFASSKIQQLADTFNVR
ncbi:oxidoreductase [bacterium]|nr:MAG: oxidoreductase [bacterium]